jgi:indolepyruvate ferredoxin oxidoreductase
VLVAGVGGTGVVTIGALLGVAAHLDGHAATVLDQTGLAQKGGAVLTHVRIGRAPEALNSPRIVHADLLLACDLLVACGADASQRLLAGRTRAVINTADAITGDIVRHPELKFPHAAALAALHQRLGHDAADAARRAGDEYDAGVLAARLAGHSIGANVLLLGHAWQRGWLPVSRAALMRAVELNGEAVADNQRAFAWGRRLAVEPQRVLAQAGLSAEPAPPQTLEQLLAQRREHLLAYQGRALVERYDAWIRRVQQAESRAAPGSEGLTRAVARSMHRLLTPKDEYEVARLFGDGTLHARIAELYEGRREVHYHLATPWQRGTAASGPAKRDWGPGLRLPLRWLARARRLRGSWLDPLRGSAESRLAAALLAEYEAAIERVLAGLSSARLDAAVAIAELPESVRGYGHVKARHAQRMREQMAAALAAYEAAAGPCEAAAGAGAAPAGPGEPAASGDTTPSTQQASQQASAQQASAQQASARQA